MSRIPSLVVAVLVAAPVLALGPLGIAHAAAPPALTFVGKGGNAWWVEAAVGGADAGRVAKVEARDSYGPWVALKHQSWGTWGASFAIEQGHLVMFRATLRDGRVATSCPFAHPSGASRCGAAFEPPGAPPPSPPPAGQLAHTSIVATTFWVGEIFDPTLPDGSQVCSTYDSQWAYHWSGVDHGKVPASAAGCPGSIVGGCDGVPGANDSCATEKRTAANGYFPTSASVTPRENPFYLDLPFDDLNDATAFNERCQVIPWANQPGFAGHCSDASFSYMKNHWVRILGPSGATCYGQVEDAGPSHGNLYHDADYVFGTKDARPAQKQFNNAGMDVSPALNGCLGFKDLDGSSDRVSWQFVDAAQVPAGPWKTLVTTSPVTP